MLRSGSFAFRPATRGRSGLLVAALALVLFYCADSHPAPRFKLEQRGDFAPSISIADVADAAFLPLPGGVPAFGQRDAPVWLRISVESSGPFVLEVGYPQLDSVTVYYRDRGGWHLAELGDTLPYSTRPLDSNYYAVPFQTMPADGLIFLRAMSRGPVLVPVTISARDDFAAHVSRRSLLFGMYFGFLTIMAIFNLFLFATLRDLAFVYYAGYLVCFIVSVLHLEGYAHQLLRHSPETNNLGFAWFGMQGYGWAVLFAASYLNLKHTLPRLNRMLTGLGLAIFIWCAAAPFVPYTMFQKLSQVAALIAVVAMMGAASHDAWHGNRSARIFLLAWVVLIVATIGLILSFNAIIRNMLLAKYSVLIGSTIEVVLIAVGLADRMLILQREKEDQQRESLERQRALTIAYARFVPPQLLDNLGRTEITQVQLGDVVKKEMTVLFSDIRGFTSLSEQMTPEENFQFLNAILRRVGPVIRQHGGFIDKYIGDAIMALFSGDPGEAIRAAVAMRGLLAIYNERRGLEGFQPIQIGMGINTGDLMLGMIGEPERLEGTVISDAVNLASRLEGLNKFYGTTILVSEQTLFRIGNPAEFASRIIDRVRVRGKRGVVTVFEIFAGDLPDVAARKEAGRGLLERGIDAMLQGEFLAAATHFAAVLEQNPDDLAARRHLDRARHHSVHGAPERWEGVTDMD